MKKFSVILIVVGLLIGVLGCSNENTTEDSRTLRIGWQPQWANQGQISVVLQESELLEEANIEGKFIPFAYGAPMTEAAAAGELDIVFAGDQPVLTLVTRSDDWVIAARLTRFRSAILIPKTSTIRSLEDMKGKRLAAAFGSTTHRDLVRLLDESGLQDEIEPIHLDGAQHAAVMQSSENWTGVDAIASWDPIVAVALSSEAASALVEWPSPGLVAVRKSLIQENRPLVVSFMNAYRHAYVHYAENSSKFDMMYAKISRLPLELKQYEELASFEPNMNARTVSEVDVILNPDLLAETQRDAEIAAMLGIIPYAPDIDKVSDSSLFE